MRIIYEDEEEGYSIPYEKTAISYYKNLDDFTVTDHYDVVFGDAFVLHNLPLREVRDLLYKLDQAFQKGDKRFCLHLSMYS